MHDFEKTEGVVQAGECRGNDGFSWLRVVTGCHLDRQAAHGKDGTLGPHFRSGTGRESLWLF
jgi:hypothetical protein